MNSPLLPLLLCTNHNKLQQQLQIKKKGTRHCSIFPMYGFSIYDSTNYSSSKLSRPKPKVGVRDVTTTIYHIKKKKIKQGHVNECPQSIDLTIHFKKVLTSLLWEMKKAVKILIVFFFSLIKTFFKQIVNQGCGLCPVKVITEHVGLLTRVHSWTCV